MKIAYVAWVPGGTETGVLKKMVFQLRAWRAAGHEVALFTLGHGDEPWQGAADLPFRVYPVRGAASWFTQAERLVDAVRELGPDVVYHRFNVYFPALERMFRRHATVVELNTLDLPEYRASMSKARFAYHRLTRGRILQGASGLVAVTEEIARSVARAGRPVLVLGNGIDLASIEPLPVADTSRTRLVLIAAKPDEPWHGLDKLLALARAMPDIEVHIVGQLGSAGPLSPNVVLHGYLGQAQYRTLLAGAVAGVAPLALHRKQMQEACPLKSREYLALGLPIIAAYRDPDFVHGAPYVLQLPNCEDNVQQSLPAIREFLQHWRQRRVDRNAIGGLDVRSKERVRLSFLSACAATRNGHP